MHSEFLNWFQGKRASGKRRQAQDRPKPLVPPFASRSRPLTPTPSCTASIAFASAATADSAFFQHLPPEIRREILVAAFGGRTMHMSLEFNHPRQLVPSSDYRKPPERYMPSTAQRPPQRLELDEQAPMAWEWCGCPCWSIGHPHNDQCLPGVARCWKHTTAVPDICLIGAMGWVQTCRQAYLEGIEVLYSTNTFHLSNKNSMVIQHLQDLLPPHRLAMITSIELDLSLCNVTGPVGNDVQYSRCPRDAGQSGFLNLLEAIPKAFPNLRAVFMDIHGFLFPGLRLAERPPFYDQYLFQPVDDMVRKLGPQLQEFTLAVPFTISQKSSSRARFEGWKSRRKQWTVSHWRPLSTLEINGQAERVLEEETPTEGSGERGYWITAGVFDDPYPLMGCFGTGSMNPELHDAINAELNSWTDKDKRRPRKA